MPDKGPVIEVASPLAMVAHRAKLAVDEARKGRLSIMHVDDLPIWPGDETGLDYLRPVIVDYLRRTWGGAMRWRQTDAGPVCQMRMEDMTLRSKPPIRLLVEDGQLHSTGGPAIVWEDGTAHCFLRGVMIPPRLWGLLMCGRLEIDEVMAARNQAVQAVLMEQIGWASAMANPRYVCTKLDHDERWGTLWHITWWPAGLSEMDQQAQVWTRREAYVCEVVNRSPEPDGHFRHYWLQVDRDCRPIMADGQLGMPQERTSLNAVASTFGMTGEMYSMLLGDES